VRGHDALDGVLVGHVAGHLVDVVAGAAQLLGGGAELVWAAGGDGERVALLAEHVGDGEADPARGPGDDRCAIGHGRNLPFDR
jgi:hypothetical protein